LFEDHPLCVLCLEANRVRAATIRDHILPLAEGGTEDSFNIQALCATCHTRKTNRESQRGQARARMGGYPNV
jgi:5-methylcytosine-specific restriction protein A